MSDTLQTATLAGGCFWCVEAIFRQLKGVERVISGYTGGTTADPSYEDLHNKDTGHAEAIQITFDPAVISYADLLEIFWHTHDPTTMNRQGADVGKEYRSAIFYVNEDQKKIAEQSKREQEASGDFKDPIVTEITPLTHFYLAEADHQDYYARNKGAPYCVYVIDPKLSKLREKYKKLLK